MRAAKDAEMEKLPRHCLHPSSFPLSSSLSLFEWCADASKRRLPATFGILGFLSLSYALLSVLMSHPCWESSSGCWPSLYDSPNHISASIRLGLGFRLPENLSPPPPPPSIEITVPPAEPPQPGTSLEHIVFGIAATAEIWASRQAYIAAWWNPQRMRGYLWFDREPAAGPSNDSSLLPPYRVSSPTDQFEYTWEGGNPSAIRISRIVSETFRMNLSGVHWFVMCDDDTVFFTENLVKVLSNYDHTLPYYIGSISESHFQNVEHSYGMGYGGAGYAISYPLAKELEKMQDRCLHRYPQLYGSDSRIQACLAELGVSLTREPGFHQIDLRGSIFGLLIAHPITPFVSLHHLDLVDSIFPYKDKFEALQHLMKAVRNDPYGVMQQSMCYDLARNYSMSVSAGYAVQIYKGLISPVDLQKPIVTFVDWRNWRKNNDGFTYDTRQLPGDSCRWGVYFMESVEDSSDRLSVINYLKYDMNCSTPMYINEVRVFQEKQNLPQLLGPRRQCCEVITPYFPFLEKRKLEIKVRDCRDGEIIAAD